MKHFEHNRSDHEDPLPAPTWLVGFIAVVLLVVIFLGLTSIYYGAMEEELVVKDYEVEPAERLKLHEAQMVRLEGPARWERTVVDGQVTERLVIPIEDAMAKIVEEAGR